MIRWQHDVKSLYETDSQAIPYRIGNCYIRLQCPMTGTGDWSQYRTPILKVGLVHLIHRCSDCIVHLPAPSSSF